MALKLDVTLGESEEVYCYTDVRQVGQGSYEEFSFSPWWIRIIRPCTFLVDDDGTHASSF